jgi:2-polyprenyl-3-methyl-5-hydroxy-6-metoxy-1,4-benzoquinol methylase
VVLLGIIRGVIFSFRCDNSHMLSDSRGAASSSELDFSSLERIVPDRTADHGATGVETLQLHLQRYQFASRALVPGTVLDIACGVGYGTRMLAQAPETVAALGVDIDEASIRYAQSRYANSATKFACADAMTYEPGMVFDSIVSLETIEHVPDPVAFVLRLASWLRPGGVLIGSVPVTLSTDANPHHASDFTERSFRRLGAAAGLRELYSFSQVQPYSLIALMRKTETRAQGVRRGLAAYYLQHPSKLLARGWTTLRYGFQNRYLTIAWEKPL